MHIPVVVSFLMEARISRVELGIVRGVAVGAFIPITKSVTTEQAIGRMEFTYVVFCMMFISPFTTARRTRVMRVLRMAGWGRFVRFVCAFKATRRAMAIRVLVMPTFTAASIVAVAVSVVILVTIVLTPANAFFQGSFPQASGVRACGRTGGKKVPPVVLSLALIRIVPVTFTTSISIKILTAIKAPLSRVFSEAPLAVEAGCPSVRAWLH